MKHRNRSGWTPETSDPLSGDEAAMQEEGAIESEPGVLALLQRVVEDGRAYADAEVARQKLRASILGTAGRDAALLVLAALFLMFGALTAFLVACVWMLAPVVGVLGALGITIIGALVLVALLLLVARSRIRHAVRVTFGAKTTGEEIA